MMRGKGEKDSRVEPGALRWGDDRSELETCLIEDTR